MEVIVSEVSSRRVVLTWRVKKTRRLLLQAASDDNDDSTIKIEIYKGTDSTPFQTFDGIPFTSKKFVVTGMKPNTDNRVVVTSYNELGSTVTQINVKTAKVSAHAVKLCAVSLSIVV